MCVFKHTNTQYDNLPIPAITKLSNMKKYEIHKSTKVIWRHNNWPPIREIHNAIHKSTQFQPNKFHSIECFPNIEVNLKIYNLKFWWDKVVCISKLNLAKCKLWEYLSEDSSVYLFSNNIYIWNFSFLCTINLYYLIIYWRRVS